MDYIHEGDIPRKMLIERLLDALGDEGSICHIPVSSNAAISIRRCLEIATRLVDLLPVVKRSYYHPDFHGSFSIKSVLPVIAPSMSYEDLEIAEGQMASVWYSRALASSDKKERHQIFENLRAYCARDTLAMVELHKALAVLPHSNS